MTPASLENRLAILDTWAEQGLRFRLDPDTFAFNWRVGARMEEWQAEHLREYKKEFAEALRFRAGLCMRCGLDAAKHPNRGGRRQVFDAVTGLAVVVPTSRPNKKFGPFEAVWEDVPAPAGDHPPMWCKSCFDAGAWEQFGWGVGERNGPHAKSAKQGRNESDDALFDGIEDDTEPEPTSEPASLF